MMRCPKCDSEMVEVPASFSASVTRCQNCHGIACPDDALSSLQRHWFLWPKHDPSDIDSGTAREGRRWDELADVACPGCGATMATIQVPGQKHIRLERCVPCRLTFFDAGEMTDLRYETLADSVRDLVTKLRGA